MRTKWLKLTCQIGLEELGSKLLNAPFSKNEKCGFDVISITSATIDVRFIEEFNDNFSYQDPFGETVTNSIVRYTIQKLKIVNVSDKIFYLIVNNPSRSLKTLVAAFTNAIQVNFSIGLVRLEIPTFIRSIKSHFQIRKIQVKKVKVVNVRFNDHSLARIEIVSASNALEDFLEHFPGQTENLERVTLILYVDKSNREITVTNSGIIVAEDDFISSIQECCIQHLLSTSQIRI